MRDTTLRNYARNVAPAKVVRVVDGERKVLDGYELLLLAPDKSELLRLPLTVEDRDDLVEKLRGGLQIATVMPEF